MFCTKSQERNRGDREIKQSFAVLARMGFKTTDSLVILGLQKAKVIRWLNTDADFCDAIKSIPNFGSKMEG